VIEVTVQTSKTAELYVKGRLTGQSSSRVCGGKRPSSFTRALPIGLAENVLFYVAYIFHKAIDYLVKLERVRACEYARTA